MAGTPHHISAYISGRFLCAIKNGGPKAAALCLESAGRARLPGMDMSKMTAAEVEALLRHLADMEREEMELVMQERREAERQGRVLTGRRDYPRRLTARLSTPPPDQLAPPC